MKSTKQREAVSHAAAATPGRILDILLEAAGSTGLPAEPTRAERLEANRRAFEIERERQEDFRRLAAADRLMGGDWTAMYSGPLDAFRVKERDRSAEQWELIVVIMEMVPEFLTAPERVIIRLATDTDEEGLNRCDEMAARFAREQGLDIGNIIDRVCGALIARGYAPRGDRAHLKRFMRHSPSGAWEIGGKLTDFDDAVEVLDRQLACERGECAPPPASDGDAHDAMFD